MRPRLCELVDHLGCCGLEKSREFRERRDVPGKGLEEVRSRIVGDLIGGVGEGGERRDWMMRAGGGSGGVGGMSGKETGDGRK